jgi:hypothetical protein
MCVVSIVVMVMLLRDILPYAIFMDVYVFVTVVNIMILRDFELYGIVMTIMCVSYFKFPRSSCRAVF